MNIGGSGAAASLGVAYGTGAINRKKLALIWSSIGIFFGAMIGSRAVITTIGKGIIKANILSNELIIIVLLSACLTLFIANIVGIPLSTSEVTVGAIISIGLLYNALYMKRYIPFYYGGSLHHS